MASLKDIRRRIISVKSTQKITRAMKLVSAAKFSRASIAAKGAAPYGEGLENLVKNLSVLGTDNAQTQLTDKRDEKNIAIIVLTTDRGLCGGLNANVLKRLAAFSNQKRQQKIACELVLLGRRGASFHKSNGHVGKLILAREKVNDHPNNQFAKELALMMVEKFKKKEIDACYIVYPKFVSALSQVPKIDQLLPVVSGEAAAGETDTKKGAPRNTVNFSNYIIEPSINQFLDRLFERQLTNKIFRAILDARASEQGARMTAMDSATNNATDVINKLTLEYNRGRQAAITKELIEITSGAQAL